MHKLTKIALFTALFLLLGHSLVPHHHEVMEEHAYIGEVRHDLGGLLGDLFQVNLGNNHLEEMRLNELDQDFISQLQADEALGLVATYLTLPDIHPMPLRSGIVVQDDSLVQLLLTASSGQRGPPRS